MKCVNCEHEPCPYCKDSCDIVAHTPEDNKKIFVVKEQQDLIDDENNYPILCCDGNCVYELTKEGKSE